MFLVAHGACRYIGAWFASVCVCVVAHSLVAENPYLELSLEAFLNCSKTGPVWWRQKNNVPVRKIVQYCVTPKAIITETQKTMTEFNTEMCEVHWYYHMTCYRLIKLTGVMIIIIARMYPLWCIPAVVPRCGRSRRDPDRRYKSDVRLWERPHRRC